MAKNWNNIPVADFGVAAYLLIAIAALSRIFFNSKTTKIGWTLSLVGSLVSIGLTAFAFVVIKNSCIWCMGSAATMIALFVVHHMLKSAKESEPVVNVVPDIGIALLCSIALAIGLGTGMQPTVDQAKFSDQVIEDLIPENPNLMGDPKAPVKIVEFLDLMCPHCRLSYNEAKMIIAKHPGKAAWVFRHFPIDTLDGHENSPLAAILSEVCSDYGKFPQFMDAVVNVDPHDLTTDRLMRIAESVGVPYEKVRSRAADPEDSAYVRFKRDIEFTAKYGLSSTPVMFIGNTKESPNPDKKIDIRRAGDFLDGLVKFGVIASKEEVRP